MGEQFGQETNVGTGVVDAIGITLP
ncbi:uncharacterized protein G2W53_032408 [Senna tora]|uniref:Uncharacterized protein n=1 Tax=Senna tora TaxID=362788 RepID=A0A834W6X5_9FABA|nr:uncharacterized protein G2W53_032408 [Senna tora]